MMKIGLALGGGAFRGMAHIGIIQVLEENGIPVDLVAGTSVGALIGGVYACGTAPRLLEKLALSLNMRDYYDVVMPREGFIKGDRMLTLLRTLTGNKDFSQTKIPFCAVAADINSGERVELSSGKLCDAIRASISLPGVFVPHRIGKRVLCDGGLVDRVPLSTARDMGADLVIAVDVGYKGYEMKPNGILEILLHAFDIMDWELTKVRVLSAEVLISPEMQHIDYTTLRDAEECIEIGRQECEKYLPAIRDAIAKKEAEMAERLPDGEARGEVG